MFPNEIHDYFREREKDSIVLDEILDSLAHSQLIIHGHKGWKILATGNLKLLEIEHSNSQERSAQKALGVAKENFELAFWTAIGMAVISIVGIIVASVLSYGWQTDQIELLQEISEKLNTTIVIPSVVEESL